MGKKRENSWEGIGEEISSRIRNALVSLPFIASFLIGVLLISGIGIWLPYALDKSGTVSFFESQNLLTYSLAFLGSMIIDLLLSESKNKNLISLSLIVGGVAMFFLIFGYLQQPKGMSILVTIGCSITILMFLFFTVNDPKYDGDGDKKIDIIAGVEGYKEININNIKDES